jgi:hypothetical protein
VNNDVGNGKRTNEKENNHATDCRKKAKEEIYNVTASLWRNKGGSIDPITDRMMDQLVEGGPHGFSTKLTPFKMGRDAESIVSVPSTAYGSTAAEWGLGLSGVSMPSVDDHFNPLVNSLFAELMSTVGTPRVSGFDEWLTEVRPPELCCMCQQPLISKQFCTLSPKLNIAQSPDITKGGFGPSTSPGTMLCTIIPMVDSKPSPSLNRVLQKEFVEVDGRVQYNDNFWDGHKLFRNQKNQGKLVMMEVAVTVPEFVLKNNQIAQHRAGVQWMNDHGCGLGGNFAKMTLYKGYVSVFMNFVTSPIVKIARLYGFRPLFLVKNTLLAGSAHGHRGMQFVTIDKDAKTQILLAGFWRMKDDNPNNLEVISVNASGSLLSHNNVFD